MKTAGWIAGGAWALAFLGIFLAEPLVGGDREVALDLEGVEVLEVVTSSIVTVEVDSRRPPVAKFSDDRDSTLRVQRRGRLLRVEARIEDRMLDLVVPASVHSYVLTSNSHFSGKETMPAARVIALRDVNWAVPAQSLRIERIPRGRSCGECPCSFTATVDAPVSRLEVDSRGGNASLRGADRIGQARLRLQGGRLSVTGAARLDQLELEPAPLDTVAAVRPEGCAHPDDVLEAAAVAHE
jgi:hypothetical protein